MPETIPITLEVMQPLRPRKGSHWLLAWRRRLELAFAEQLPEAEMWTRSGVRVLSNIELAQLPDGAGVGPQWHVSISRYPNRADKRDVERALRDFGMVGAEEDNHEPGTARHFWLPVDAEHRMFGKRCPLHGEQVAL